jgi:FixJ family two-component response regulator
MQPSSVIAAPPAVSFAKTKADSPSRVRTIPGFLIGRSAASRETDEADNDGSQAPPLVVVIDGNAAVQETMRELLEPAGLRVSTFGAAPDLAVLATAACLVMDVRLPRRSGLEVQQQLIRAGQEVPVIFMSASADIVTSVRAMKAGALDFLEKPFRDQDMLDAVLAAISVHEDRRRTASRDANLKARFAQLTSRERQIMALVTEGLLNKQVAGRLGLSEVTVKMYRKQVMIKMGAPTLPDLVRCASALDLHGSAPPALAAALDVWPSAQRPAWR